MKKIFTLAAAVLASFSLWATSVSELSFSEPTALPEGYVYSSTNTPAIATVGNKSAVYVTNGGGGSVSAACFSEDGLVAGQGKRWMGFVADEESSVVISVYSSQKVWTLYKSDGTAFATYTNTAKTWEDWAIETLPAGQYILTAGSSQCYVSAITFTGGTPSTDPVESAEISGENACVIGGSVELTCNAPKATTYQWYLGGAAIEGANAKKYTFTPTAAGEYSFTCAASNDYTATPVVAAAHVVTVTDPAAACGELIKATHTGGKTATVTGVLGGTADKNTANDGKFGGKGQYFGITLASGAFQAGDELNVHTSTAAQQGTIAIYADKAGATLLYDTESMGAEGDNIIILPTALNNATTLYICRTEANTWNGYVDYIAVNRSCEASSNAEIASLTINGEAVEAVEGVYSYTVGATVNLAAVEVVYTLAHPKASATPASGFMVDVPNASDPANTQVITVTAQDGSQATYTVSVAKSAQANNDATLSALSVDGYTLAPAFASDVLAYTITKAYGAENPAATAIHATPNDANASAIVMDAINNVFSVEVTAEDGTTSQTYTITVVEAAAKKALLRATFSNGVHGFIANGNIDVPYIAGEAVPTFVGATFWQADGEPTAEVVGGNLVVTGIDSQTDTYTITYVPLTPAAAYNEEIIFDGVPSYVHSVYGWDENKGLKFSKDVEEASNHRISEGKDRIYMALPAAQNFTLTGGSAGSRPVEVVVNGHIVQMDTKTPKSGETFSFDLDPTKANLVGIESRGNNGDAGFTKLFIQAPFPTAIENSEVEMKAVKVVRNGQLFIEKNGVLYNAQGAIVK